MNYAVIYPFDPQRRGRPQQRTTAAHRIAHYLLRRNVQHAGHNITGPISSIDLEEATINGRGLFTDASTNHAIRATAETDRQR